MKRAKLYEENGGYIVMVREGGNVYLNDTPKNIFTDLDKALAFMKEFMIQVIDEKPKQRKKKASAK